MSMDKSYFPRDESGKVKTKQACQTPGCDWPNWHICLVGKPDTFPQLLRSERVSRPRKSPGVRSEEHRANISAAQTARWAKIKEANRERDAAIIDRYLEGDVGYIGLAKEFKVGKDRILRVLKEAEKEGKVTIRRRGRTLANGAK